MKKIYSSAILLFAAGICFSQTLIPIDTANKRYWDPAFFAGVTVTSNVTYGSSTTVSNTTQILKMDIYQPTGDTVSERPVLVIAHGGSFIGGSKTNFDVVTLCTQFAKMGYVCASIDYRLGMGFPIDSVNATKAVIRAVQDMKAAIRFFRQDFYAGNQYKIHPNYIFAGGSSAGAFMGLHLAYLDKISEIPSWINISSLGGLDGNSGNPGFSWHVNGVINLCGALGDSTWIEPNDVPFVSMHGTADNTVPYGTAMIYVSGFPIMVVDGSHSLNLRAINTNTSNPFYTFIGADHVPYAGTSPTQVAYMDTTVLLVKTFLRPLLTQPSFTGINSPKETISLSIYPNPSQGDVYVNFESAGTINYKAQLLDVSGRIISSFHINSSLYHFSTAEIAEGIYFLKMENGEGEIITRKIVIR